jgi:dynein heavy chain
MLVANFLLFFKKGAAIEIEFNGKWLTALKMTQRQGSFRSPMLPTIVFFAENLTKYSTLEVDVLRSCFNKLITRLESSLSKTSDNLELELRGFGSIFKAKKVLYFQSSKSVPLFNSSSRTVKDIIQMQLYEQMKSTQINIPDSQLLVAGLHRPLDALVNQDSTNYYMKKPDFETEHPKPTAFKITTKPALTAEKSELTAKLTGSKSKNHEFWTRNIKASNPLAKESTPSEYDTISFNPEQFLTRTLKTAGDMMMNNSLNSVESKMPIPRILDHNSQTRASPVTIVYNSLSVSSRIGSNFTPLSKYLHLDPKKRMICVIYNNENNIFYSNLAKENVAESPYLAKSSKVPISEAALVRVNVKHFFSSHLISCYDSNPEKYENLRQVVLAMKDSIERFDKCLEEVIRDYDVVDFPKSLVPKINKRTKNRYPGLNETLMENHQKDTYSEIVDDFKKSLKKGLLLYILKDQEEREKLGIAFVPEDAEEGLEATSSNAISMRKENFIDKLSQGLMKNLYLFSDTTNSVVNCWGVLDTDSFFDFSVPAGGLSLKDFIIKQKNSIIKVKNYIVEDWSRKVSEIYKVKIKKMSKLNSQRFFQAMGTVASSQLREMVERSLHQFREFLDRFDDTKFHEIEAAHEKILEMQSNSDNYFLVIKLKQEEKRLVFEHEADSIVKELTDIVKDVVKYCENIARPENFIHQMENNNLRSLSINEPIVEDLLELIRVRVEANFAEAQRFDVIFSRFYYLFNAKEMLATTFVAERNRHELLLEAFKSYEELESELTFNFVHEIPLNMFKIDANEIKLLLIGISRDLRASISNHIFSELVSLSSKIYKSLKTSVEGIPSRIETTEKLIETENWINNFQRHELAVLQGFYGEMIKWIEKFFPHVRFPFDTLKQIYETKQQLIDYTEKIEKEKLRIQSERESFEKRLRTKHEMVQQRARELQVKIDSFKKNGKLFCIDQTLIELSQARNVLNEILLDIEQINSDETILGFSKSEFENVKVASHNISLFETLWQDISEWMNEQKKWELTAIFKFDIEKIEERVVRISTNLNNIVEDLRKNKSQHVEPIQLAEKILSEIQNFTKKFKLVKHLCIEGLRGRHWVDINQVLIEKEIDYSLESGGNFYMSTLEDYHIYNCEAEIAEISEKAAKEFQNEKLIASIEEYWHGELLELQAFKTFTDVFVISLKAIDDILAMISDHMLKLQTMKISPYAAIFKEQIDSFEVKLTTCKRVIKLWAQIQGQWIYLEPIFGSEDISKSLPHESKKFQETTNDFKHFVFTKKKNPFVKDLWNDSALIGNLNRMLEALQSVDNNFENYLDKKRNAFPRFYFISSDALIEIISNSKSPEKVQCYLKNLFEGIQRVRINEDEEVESMISSEGEEIVFTQKIQLKNFKGFIEKWLSLLEETMIFEVKKLIVKALQDYADKPQDNFIVGRPSQAVINACITVWSFESEEVISKKGFVGLKSYVTELDASIKQLVDLHHTQLSPLDRNTLESLIITMCHCRDIVRYLIECKVNKETDYAWESQMRFSWEPTGIIENDNSKIHLLHTSYVCGYEYLGNVQRLVITPVTNRCFQFFCLTMQSNSGSMLEGPAATGKTETIKDLSRAMAKYLVVYNCSEQMDYKLIGRIFKGLATSGNWCCLDEFNRIDFEVLSVIAQQLQRIQTTLAEKKTELIFEGSLIKFKSQCSVFATVNPGYTTRSILPDNLKSSFRTFALITPNYHKIAEVRLFSFGFEWADDLARKMINVYNLCRTQINFQKHYDHSMRTINSTIELLRELKKKYPSNNEYNLVIEALVEINSSKFATEDMNLFKCLIRDVFYEPEKLKSSAINNDKSLEITNLIVQNQSNDAFLQSDIMRMTNASFVFNPNMSMLRSTINEAPPPRDTKSSFVETSTFPSVQIGMLDPSPYFVEKCNQLYKLMLRKTGIIMLGETYSGKSTCFNLVSKLFGDSKLFKINPKSMLIGELFGSYDTRSSEWVNGVLPSLIKLTLQEEFEFFRKIIAFDGPIEGNWIESMNTVLDDNKKLCLPNGDVFYIPETMNVIFESETLVSASPATISRCGILYFESNSLSWKSLLLGWIHNFTFIDNGIVDRIMIFFQTVYEPFIAFLETLTFVIKTNNNHLFDMFKAIAQSFVEQVDAAKPTDGFDTKELIAVLDQVFLYAMIWAYGTSVNEASRKPFDLSLKKFSQMADKNLPSELWKAFRKVAVPEVGSLFDYRLSLKINTGSKPLLITEWRKWSESLMQLSSPTLVTPNKEVIVYTVDTLRYSSMMDVYSKNGANVLIWGNVGCGKSTFLAGYSQELDKETNQIVQVTFSKSVTCHELRLLIDDNLIKKSREQIFTSSKGKKFLKVIIEDVNMAQLDQTRSSSALEFIKFCIDEKGYYDIGQKRKGFKNIQGLSFICTLSSHSNMVSLNSRQLSRFFPIQLSEPDEASLQRIFSQLIDSFCGRQLSEDIASRLPKMISATVEVYGLIKRRFHQNPQNCNFIFTAKDIDKVIRGMASDDFLGLKEVEDFSRVWTFEVWHFFSNAMSQGEDRLTLLNEIVKSCFNKVFGSNFDSVFCELDLDGDKMIKTVEELDALCFSDIMPLESKGQGIYSEQAINDKLKLIVKSYAEAYNASAGQRVNLSMIPDAICYFLSLYKILGETNSNCLFVGRPGFGKRSLVKLAAFALGTPFCEPDFEVSHSKQAWLENLLSQILSFEKNGKLITLMVEDHFKKDYVMSDVGNLMSHPCFNWMMDKDSLRSVTSSLDSSGMYPSREFYSKFKQNFHFVLSFTSQSGMLREIAQEYPSIIANSRVIFVNDKQNEAIKSVAICHLSGKLDTDSEQKALKSLFAVYLEMKKIAEEFKQETQQDLFCGTNKFYQMSQKFIELYTEKNDELRKSIIVYRNGFELIQEAQTTLAEINLKMQTLQPELETASKEVEKLLTNLEIQKQQAETHQAEIAKEEEIAREQSVRASALSEECRVQIEAIEPELQSALEKIRKITRSEIEELRIFKNPPQAIQLSLQALSILLNTPVEMKKDQTSLQMEPDWWTTSKKTLNDLEISTLTNFSAEKDLDEPRYRKLEALMNDPKSKELLNETAIKFSSVVAAGLFLWVKGQIELYNLHKELQPKKEALQVANRELSETTFTLSKKSQQLVEINKTIRDLNIDYINSRSRKTVIEKEYQQCMLKIKRSNELMTSFPEEKDRWAATMKTLEEMLTNNFINSLLSSCVINYLGPLPQTWRERVLSDIVKLLVAKEVCPPDLSFNFPNFMLSTIDKKFMLAEFSNDQFLVANSLIMRHHPGTPFVIDPQQQGVAFLRRHLRDSSVTVIRSEDRNLEKKLGQSIAMGVNIIIEDMGSAFPPEIEVVLRKRARRDEQSATIRIGENHYDYNSSFRLFLTTKQSRPRLQEELSHFLSVMNMSMTETEMTSQVLSILINFESPELETQYNQMIKDNIETNIELKAIEEKILKVLSSDQKLLIEDEKSIQLLTASKAAAEKLIEKRTMAKNTEIQLKETREEFKGLSSKIANLYFAVERLERISPYYKYHVSFFFDILAKSLEASPRSDVRLDRFENIYARFFSDLYTKIEASLFNEDKTLFLLFLMYHTDQSSSAPIMSRDLMRFIIDSSFSQLELYKQEKPDFAWLTDKIWNNAQQLARLDKFFDDLPSRIENMPDVFEAMVNVDSLESPNFPTLYEQILNKFQKLALICCFNMNNKHELVESFVTSAFKEVTGMSLPTARLELNILVKSLRVYEPLLFVIARGKDPASSIQILSEKSDTGLEVIAIGQGQYEKVLRLIDECSKKGQWIMLKNCHLGKRIWQMINDRIEEMKDNPKDVNPNFRLFMTTFPDDSIPEKLIKNTFKVIKEPPSSFKGMFLDSLKNDFLINPENVDNCERKDLFQRISVGLCLLYSSLIERKKYGVSGWKETYDFNESDLTSVISHLHLLLNKRKNDFMLDSFKIYLIDTYFGSRIKNPFDLRVLTELVNDLLNESNITKNKIKIKKRAWQKPVTLTSISNRTALLQLIEVMPEDHLKRFIGLNFEEFDNKNIELSRQISLKLNISFFNDTVRDYQTHSSESLMNALKSINEYMPSILDTNALMKKLQAKPEDYAQHILLQEIRHYNSLIGLIKRTLETLEKGFYGSMVMSKQTEDNANCILNDIVPLEWSLSSNIYTKSLLTFTKKLRKKTDFIKEWLASGNTNCFYLPALFGPETMLTYIIQVFSKKSGVSVDKVRLEAEFLPASIKQDKKVEALVILEGVMLDGAQFDFETKALKECRVNDTLTNDFCLKITPFILNEDISASMIELPLYKTYDIKDFTNIISENLVFSFFVKVESDSNIWLKRSIAFYLESSY